MICIATCYTIANCYKYLFFYNRLRAKKRSACRTWGPNLLEDHPYSEGIWELAKHAPGAAESGAAEAGSACPKGRQDVEQVDKRQD